MDWRYLKNWSDYWAQLRKELLDPKVDEALLEKSLREAREKIPVPVLWLIGKTQAGKTSIIRALTGSENAEIGNGFQPCTRQSRFFDFPAEAPVVRFLDTRGLGEVAYDPGDDIHYCESKAHLLIAVMKVADLQQQSVFDVLHTVRARHPEWPLQDLYVRFRKDLAPEIDDNMKAIPRKQRAMVRKGIKNGLRSEIDVDAGRFFALYADNVHRHGTPALPRRYFEALQRVFGSDCEALTVVDSGGRPLSAVLSFYFRDEVLPYYAGDEVSARHLAANDFKYWELMRRACERGIKSFDYGRSKQGTGSYSFKKNWGFEPQPLFYEHCLYRRDSIPQNNPANAKYRLLIETWRRMPIGLANWLGPFIVRNLG